MLEKGAKTGGHPRAIQAHAYLVPTAVKGPTPRVFELANRSFAYFHPAIWCPFPAHMIAKFPSERSVLYVGPTTSSLRRWVCPCLCSPLPQFFKFLKPSCIFSKKKRGEPNADKLSSNTCS